MLESETNLMPKCQNLVLVESIVHVEFDTLPVAYIPVYLIRIEDGKDRWISKDIHLQMVEVRMFENEVNERKDLNQ